MAIKYGDNQYVDNQALTADNLNTNFDVVNTFLLFWLETEGTTYEDTGCSVSFKGDRFELRCPGSGSAEIAAGIHSTTNILNSDTTGELRVKFENVSLDDDVSPRITLGFGTVNGQSDSYDSGTSNWIQVKIQGDGTIALGNNDGSTNTETSSKTNSFVNDITEVVLTWNGSQSEVTVYTGSSGSVSLTNSSNYPTGLDRELFFEAQDEDQTTQYNCDYDITGWVLRQT